MNLSDIHRRVTYMHINYQQYRASRSVKTCPQLYAKIGKLHKFLSCHKDFEKLLILEIHYPTTDIYVKFEFNQPLDLKFKNMLVLCTLFRNINRFTTMKVDSTYFGLINQQRTTSMPRNRARTHDHRIGSQAPYHVTTHKYITLFN